jgi:hypothetical protein
MVSCVSFLDDQNIRRKDIMESENPWYLVKVTGYTIDQFLTILLEIEQNEKWEIFREYCGNIYFGKLRNKNIVSNLYYLEMVRIKHYIPLYDSGEIHSIAMTNISAYLVEHHRVEPPHGLHDLQIKFVRIDGIKDFYRSIYELPYSNEEIKYHIEVTYDYDRLYWIGKKRVRRNFVVITDTEFNVLDSHLLVGFGY